MAADWERPKDLPYPMVWRKFTRTMSDGREHKFRIQDASQDMFDEIFDLFKVHFMTEEPICSILDMVNDEVSLKEMELYWKSELQRKTLIVCFEEVPDGKDVLVSCNVMGVRTKGNLLKVAATGRALVAMNKIMNHIWLEVAKIYEAFNVDKYLSAYGLSVHRDYRGIGIGVEMLLARTEYCKANKIDFTVTAFTSKGGQRAGEKAGFDFHFSKLYSDIQKDTGVDLTGINHDCIKVLYKRFD